LSDPLSAISSRLLYLVSTAKPLNTLDAHPRFALSSLTD
jgi:hypothetical protein